MIKFFITVATSILLIFTAGCQDNKDDFFKLTILPGFITGDKAKNKLGFTFNAIQNWKHEKDIELRVVGFYNQPNNVDAYIVLQLKNFTDKIVSVPYAKENILNTEFFKIIKNGRPVWVCNNQGVDKVNAKLMGIYNLKPKESVFYIYPYYLANIMSYEPDIAFMLALTEKAQSVISSEKCLGVKKNVSSEQIEYNSITLDKFGNYGPSCFQFSNLKKLKEQENQPPNPKP